jgi:hypothetical protein
MLPFFCHLTVVPIPRAVAHSGVLGACVVAVAAFAVVLVSS